jgi:hypothetical protein
MAWGKECTEGTIQERIEAVRTKIRKRMELRDQYDLETQTADEIWKDYLKYQIEYFERYLKELEITTLDTL